jgi:hypothetical protein
MSFTVSAFPGATFTGVLARIARARPPQRTVSHRAGDERGVDDDRPFVVRVRDAKTEWVVVTTGLNAGPPVEAFGALKPGDEVATQGTDELRPDTAVRPRDGATAAG